MISRAALGLWQKVATYAMTCAATCTVASKNARLALLNARSCSTLLRFLTSVTKASLCCPPPTSGWTANVLYKLGYGRPASGHNLAMSRVELILKNSGPSPRAAYTKHARNQKPACS